jgi:hypothetical protein
MTGEKWRMDKRQLAEAFLISNISSSPKSKTRRLESSK